MACFRLISFFVLTAGIISLGAPKNQDEEVGAQLQKSEGVLEGAQNKFQKIFGVLDVRPSAVLKGEDTFRFENSAEVGYQLNPKFQVLYHQDFTMNLYNPATQSGVQGVGLQAMDGFIDWFREAWMESQDGSISLSYEGRLYVPLAATRRDAGMITALRNYFILGKKLSNGVSVNLIEAPILHFYDQPSYLGKANPAFENRLGIQLAYKFQEKWSFSLPLLWSATQLRTVSQSTGSRLDHFVWINPEISYAADSHYTLGLGYYDNTSLISSDLSSFQVGEGLEDGIVQFFVRASL